MAKIWVLDTGTKGTGAEMMPLDRALEKKRPVRDSARVGVVRPKPDGLGDGAGQDPVPRGSRSFKVVEVVNGLVLVEGVPLPEAVDVLRGVRSVIDVHVYVWEPSEEEWRPLTIPEQKRVWALRHAERAP